MSGAGLDLGTGEYRVEANAFLESRLRLVYAFVLGAAVFFYLLGYTTTLIEYGTAAANPWRWGRWIHLLGIGGLGSAYWRLRTKGPFGERALNRFDALEREADPHVEPRQQAKGECRGGVHPEADEHDLVSELVGAEEARRRRKRHRNARCGQDDQ